MTTIKPSEIFGCALSESGGQWPDIYLLLVPELIDEPCPPEYHNHGLEDLVGASQQTDGSKYRAYREAKIAPLRRPGDTYEEYESRYIQEYRGAVARSLRIKSERLAALNGGRR